MFKSERSGLANTQRAVTILLLLVLTLIVALPMVMMVLGSLKDAREAAEMNLKIPSTWHFENYLLIFKKVKLLRAMWNSIFITSSAVVLTVLVSSAAAFYLGRVENSATKILSNLFYLGLIAPIAIITTIKLLQMLGISGTYIGVILVFSALNTSISVFLVSGFVKTIPRDLDEAAILDGCGPARLFFNVILPLLAPVVATASIIVFMAVWNSFMIPLYLLNQSTKWTMPLMVYSFFGQYLSDWHLVFADLVVTALPVLLVYAFAQRYIIEGMAAGAIKG